MTRKDEAPKGEAFLPGTSAAELREMAKRADNGIDSIRYSAYGNHDPLRAGGLAAAACA